MATKTVIKCLEHSTASEQPNQGISIIIDQHSQPTEQELKMQQVYESASSNLNVIKIQHSNEQKLQPQQQQQYLTLNNKNNNNKTLIDINRNNNHDDDDCVHNGQNNNEIKNELVLQINCSSTSNEISRQKEENKMENFNAKKLEIENNGFLTERGNDHNEVQCNEEKKFNEIKNGHKNEKFDTSKNTKQQATDEDEEESGQTASQQHQQHYHQQQLKQQPEQVDNGNSKNRENGQNSLNSQIKLQLNDHTNTEHNNDVNVANNSGKQLHNQVFNTNKTQNVLTNREDNNEVCNNSSGLVGVSSDCSLVQREVVDLSHAKRSVNEENSNSLLTPADASTCTQSAKTQLTINAKVPEALNQNDSKQIEYLTKKEKIINHVVKIQIKPNNLNIQQPQQQQQINSVKTLTEKQITVVKIENLQELKNETTEQNITSDNNKKENQTSENQEDFKTSVSSQSQQTYNDKMVQKPINNNNNTVTVVSNGNGNTNGNVSNISGTATGTTVTELNVSNPNNYLYYVMSSGQFSPCDTLDSGTGSDLESNGQLQQSVSPNLQLKKSSTSSASSTTSTISNNSSAALELHLKTTKVLVANSNNSLDMQQRQCSFTDSEESEASSLSCDSLHSNEFLRQSSQSPIHLKSSNINGSNKKIQTFLPDSLLREIKNLKFSSNDYEAENEEDEDNLSSLKTHEKSDIYPAFNNKDYIKSHEFMQSRKNLNNLPTTISSSLKRASLPSKTFVLNTEDGTFIDTKMNSMPRTYEADKYYNFHVNEHDNFRTFGNNDSLSASTHDGSDSMSISDYETKSLHDDVFAGYKDLRCGSNTSTIRSSKGTVRGVKNRVRNGIATFLQLQQPNIKNYKEKDSGKVVLYTTSMGIIRDTYAKCSNVKQILRTLLVKFEERDVFMSVEYQQEIKERMHSDVIKVPQLYVEGQHIGDADTVERLNESGELRQLLKPYKSISTTYTCQTCGGYRLLPCPSCNGSKKSVHRNHFTAEFVALKCMNCDEVGLVKCHNC